MDKKAVPKQDVIDLQNGARYIPNEVTLLRRKRARVKMHQTDRGNFYWKDKQGRIYGDTSEVKESQTSNRDGEPVQKKTKNATQNVDCKVKEGQTKPEVKESQTTTTNRVGDDDDDDDCKPQQNERQLSKEEAEEEAQARELKERMRWIGVLRFFNYVEGNNFEKVKETLENGDVKYFLDARDAKYNENTALHMALKRRKDKGIDKIINEKIIDLLIEYGSDVYAKNSKGETPWLMIKNWPPKNVDDFYWKRRTESSVTKRLGK